MRHDDTDVDDDSNYNSTNYNNNQTYIQRERNVINSEHGSFKKMWAKKHDSTERI